MAATNIFFLLFLLLPFQFSVGAFQSSDLPIIRLVIPILFCAWLLKSLTQRKFFLPTATTLFFLTAFLGWATLSIFWADNALWATKKVLFWLNFILLFFVLVDSFRNQAIREKALKGIIYGGTAIAAVGIFQFILQFFIPLPVLAAACLESLRFFLGTNFANTVSEYPSILVNIGGSTFLRAFGFFPDPHIFAYYTSMIFPLAFIWAQKKDSFSARWLAPALLLFATLLSFSRASYVAIIVIGVLVALVVIWRLYQKVPVLWLLFSFMLFGVLLLSPVTTRLASSFSVEDGSVSERLRLSKEALENIAQAPFQGVGLGNYPLTVKPTASVREPIYVHNLYLDIAVELGLVGLFLFLSFIISCIPNRTLGKGTNSAYRLALLSSLGIFLVHSFFEYPIFSVHILPLLLAVLALLAVDKRQ